MLSDSTIDYNDWGKGLHFSWCRREAKGIRNLWSCVVVPSAFGMHLRALTIVFPCCKVYFLLLRMETVPFPHNILLKDHCVVNCNNLKSICFSDSLIKKFLEVLVHSNEQILRRSMVFQTCTGAGEEKMMTCTKGTKICFRQAYILCDP